MIPSDKIAKFIRLKEGDELKAYQDDADVWTIGTGATFYQDGTRVKQGDQITQQQSDELLKFHLKHASGWVPVLIRKPLNQNQYDALTSFIFNFGPEKFKNYTLRSVINSDPNNFESIGSWWRKYVFAGGKRSNGLIKRRNQEFNIYQYGKYETV